MRARTPLEDAAWDLLGAMREADFARWSVEQIEARFKVTEMRERLHKLLSDLEDARP